MRKMPIGIQDFEGLVTDGFVYVDKTAWVHKLANEGVYYFLGRPRRFGKSLLLSTLKAYFEGKKELFKGLAIEKLEREWASYPVLHVDLSVEAYRNLDDLNAGLNTNLEEFEKQWEIDPQEAAGRTPSARLRRVIQTAYERTGRKVVVLIDEYDRPLTETMVF